VAKKPKALTDFEEQNPASKKLVKDFTESLDLMLKNLVKEVNAFFTSKDKR
jgi:hypothetical protein